MFSYASSLYIYILCDLGTCIILSAINLNKTIIIVFSNVKLMNTWPDNNNNNNNNIYLKSNIQCT